MPTYLLNTRSMNLAAPMDSRFPSTDIYATPLECHDVVDPHPHPHPPTSVMVCLKTQGLVSSVCSS